MNTPDTLDPIQPWYADQSPLPGEGAAHKLWRVLLEDRQSLHPRLLLTGALLALLPRGAFNGLRAAAYRRLLGIEVGRNARFTGPLRLRGMGSLYRRLTIGADAQIGEISIALNAPVSIGDRVSIGDGCFLTTDTHLIGTPERRMGRIASRPIRIEDGCWIDSRVIIHPGVTIGAGSVVAADAVVTRDVPANSLVAGIPARVICTLAEAASAVTWLEMLGLHSL